MDKLIHDDKGSVTISNDGATIMKLLDIVHPAAKILVDIAKSQDSEVQPYLLLWFQNQTVFIYFFEHFVGKIWVLLIWVLGHVKAITSKNMVC